MKIADIDYFAASNKSWLRNIPPIYKIIFVLVVLTASVLSTSIIIPACLYLFLVLIVLFSSVEKNKILIAALYPLVFLVLYFVSINNLSVQFALFIVLRAVSITTALMLIVFTTPFVEIFSALKKILPLQAVNIMFLTYRSFFILIETFENTLTIAKIRGKLDFNKPVLFLKTTAGLIGHLIVKAVDSSEKMSEALKLRGYNGNV